jgi:general secretion pathway protein G
MRTHSLSRHLRRSRGFNLIELMVVITIIALLSGVVALNLFGAVGDAKRTKSAQDIALFATALDLYKLEKGRYPNELRELTQATKRNPDGFVKKIRKDPWENDYVYQRADRGYTLISYGADGAEGGEGEDADVNPLEDEDE